MNKLWDTFFTMLGVIGLCFIIYGLYYLGKNLSYSIFYSDMVKDTIFEIVKTECLK